MNSREIAFSEPYIELGNNEIVISAIKKVPLKNGTGFAAIDFSFAGIEEIFTDISLGEKDEIFLLNGEGNYLYNKDKNKVLTSNFFVDNRIDRNVENQVRSSDLIFQEINRGSSKYYLSTTKLENSDWYVVILIDKGSLFERIDNIFLIDFIISFLVLVVIIVIINGHIASYFSSLRDVRMALVNISEKKFDETEIAEGNKDELVKEIFEYLSELNYSLRNIVDKESDSRLAKIEKEIEDIKLSMEKVYGDLQQPINVIATTESFLKKLVEINSKKADNGLMTSDDLDKLLHDVEEVNSIVKNNLNKIIKHSEKLNYSKFNS
jgi:methyl-accepting chemotaxis protein